MLNKLVGWIVNTPLHDAQRELIKEQTRRLKIKTDLQEKRRGAREEKRKSKEELANRMHLVATMHIHFTLKNKPAYVVLDFMKSKTHRRLEFNNISIENDNGIGKYDINSPQYSSCKDFCVKTDEYRMIAEPWLNSTITTEQAKTIAKSNFTKKDIKFVVLNEFINKT